MKDDIKNVASEEIADDKEMWDALVGLAGTPAWGAIMRYNRRRDKVVMQSLKSIDPFKETTQMARVQGIGIGIFDLEGGVMEEINRRNKENAKSSAVK